MDNYSPFVCTQNARSLYKEFESRKNLFLKDRLPDIIGYEDLLEEIDDLLITPLKYPEEYSSSGGDGISLLSSTRGVLLYSAPGVGKTLIARHIAKQLTLEHDYEVWQILASDIIKTAFVGDSESRLQCIFKMIHNSTLRYAQPKQSKSILEELFSNSGDLNFDGKNIFTARTMQVSADGKMKPINSIEDLVSSESVEVEQDDQETAEDTFIPHDKKDKNGRVLLIFDEGEEVFTRNKKHNGGVVAELLNQLNDMKNFSVILMTNHPEQIDPALRRRLGNSFCVRLPTKLEKRRMISYYIEHDGWKMDPLDWEMIDEGVELFSGDDILRLTQWIARRKIRGLKPPFRQNATPFNNLDFKAALKYVHPTSSREELGKYAIYSSKYNIPCYESFLPPTHVHQVNVTEEEPKMF